MTDKLFKNISFSGLSQFFYTAMAFILVPIATRYLGKDGYGLYSLATTLGFFVVLLSDLGLHVLITREVAKLETIARALYNEMLSVKLVLSFGGLLLLLAYIALSDLSRTAQFVILVYGLSALMASFAQFSHGLFRGLQRMHFETLSVSVDKFVSVALGILLLLLGFGIKIFILSFLISGIIRLLFLYRVIITSFFRLCIRFHLRRALTFIGTSYPFGLSIFLSVCYNYADILMLSWMSSFNDIGLYAASYKLLTLIHIIPMVLATAFLPQLTIARANRLDISQLFAKSVSYLALFAIPLIPMVWILAKPIVFTVFGDQYVGSIVAIRILVFAAFFQMFNALFVPLYTALDMQRKLVRFQMFGLILNLVFNAILIPFYSYVGAAITTVLTESFILFALTLRARREIFHGLSPFRPFLGMFSKLLLATLILAAVAWGLKSIFFPLLFLILLSLYLVLLHILNCIDVPGMVKTGWYLFKNRQTAV